MTVWVSESLVFTNFFAVLVNEARLLFSVIRLYKLKARDKPEKYRPPMLVQCCHWPAT